MITGRGIELDQVRFEGDGAQVRLTFIGKAGDPWPVEHHEVEDNSWRREDAPGSLVLWRDLPGDLPDKPFALDLTPWLGGARLLMTMACGPGLGLILEKLKQRAKAPPSPPNWSIEAPSRSGDAIFFTYEPHARVASVSLGLGPDGLDLEMRVSLPQYDLVVDAEPVWRVERVDGLLRASWGNPDPPIRWDLSPALATGELTHLWMHSMDEEGTLSLDLQPDVPATLKAVAASAPVPLSRGLWGKHSLRLPGGAQSILSCRDGKLSLMFFAKLPVPPRKRK